VVRDSFISTGFGSVMSTVEILSEASSRVSGGVDAESLEELIWNPFIAFHQRTHSPATWDSFIRQFIKLVSIFYPFSSIEISTFPLRSLLSFQTFATNELLQHSVYLHTFFVFI
jgi:hypothetical protein